MSGVVGDRTHCFFAYLLLQGLDDNTLNLHVCLQEDLVNGDGLACRMLCCDPMQRKFHPAGSFNNKKVVSWLLKSVSEPKSGLK